MCIEYAQTGEERAKQAKKEERAQAKLKAKYEGKTIVCTAKGKDEDGDFKIAWGPKKNPAATFIDADSLSKQRAKDFKDGAEVEGLVTAVNENFITVNFGSKAKPAVVRLLTGHTLPKIKG
jgi:hypothetical protein